MNHCQERVTKVDKKHCQERVTRVDTNHCQERVTRVDTNLLFPRFIKISDKILQRELKNDLLLTFVSKTPRLLTSCPKFQTTRQFRNSEPLHH